MNNFVERLKSLHISIGIGETSRITGATTTQIRYWEKKGLISSVRRADGTNKRYTLKSIVSIVFIKTQLDEGYTLAKAADEVKQYLKNSDALELLLSSRLETITAEGETAVFDFGPIDNMPNSKILAKVSNKDVKLSVEEYK
ncbi:MerR family transcriptional regulator [Lentilactobacillus sp. SPB1-3]|uniref:MerR family transcriptional regulator n=1 Tax=Lentilactobacillus terminaliae TaxID=3003483 RepID=A0ACD5DEE6_9LACO|nr:MerR family transcriptional regulator [Lentilactobacillus sp. SPB1-3]MCZ0976277.1 MerR family transcriptional regulator [Lentilactobacillus sp. SPB1-3]